MNHRRPSPLASGSGRRYPLIGVVVLIVLGLVAIATAAYLLLANPSTALTTVLLALGVVCTMLAFGLLYLLFTIERTFKAIRGAFPDEMGPSRPPARDVSSATGAGTHALAATPTIEYGRESRDVEILEGIGTVFSRRLARHGIATLNDLRAAPVRQVASAAQVGDPIAQRWKLMADLMLVPALDAQASELLVLCGIESVEELAQETAESLLRKARLVNHSQVARIYPAELNVNLVDGWIQAAKEQTIPGKLHTERGRFGRGKTSA